MNIAIVGCGYVADRYMATLASYPELRLAGVYDRCAHNLDAFCRHWKVPKYDRIEELTGDDGVELVLNLTNPRSHFEVTSQCLEAGKHVYSEKPLAMTYESAQQLVALAERKNRLLSAAPCSILSETAQTLWKAIREEAVGKVRLIYANFDDGMIAPNQSPWLWRSESGIPWPAKDEFEVGCTFEHAGYVLTWLGAFFGPALSVTSFASCQIPAKGIAVDTMAPDFTVGCVEYADGIVARVTCGLVAPRDKSVTVIGDAGTLFVGNVRNDRGPVYLRRTQLGRLQSRLARSTQWLQRWFVTRLGDSACDALFQRRYTPVRTPRRSIVGRHEPVDFMKGPAELAEAIRDRRPCRLSAQFAAHIVELVEALQHPERFGGRKRMASSFSPIQPLS